MFYMGITHIFIFGVSELHKLRYDQDKCLQLINVYSVGSSMAVIFIYTHAHTNSPIYRVGHEIHDTCEILNKTFLFEYLKIDI